MSEEEKSNILEQQDQNQVQSHEQNLNQVQEQPQQPQSQQIPPSQQSRNTFTPSQAECMAFVKFARYAALTTDRLAGALLQMTAKLEDEGILKPGRSSRIERDKKLSLYAKKIQKSDSDISDMMKLIPNHPDAEKLISSLFKGVRNVVTNVENLTNLTESIPTETIQYPINNIMNNDTFNNNDNELGNENNQHQEVTDIIKIDTDNQSQGTQEPIITEVQETVENVAPDTTVSDSKE